MNVKFTVKTVKEDSHTTVTYVANTVSNASTLHIGDRLCDLGTMQSQKPLGQ